MKALFFNEHGGPENLQFGEQAMPEVGRRDVLIKVKACALNRLDLWVLEGWPALKLPLPHIGGADIAGEVVEVGSSVHNIPIGQRVVVNPGIRGREDKFTEAGDESLSPNYTIIGEHRHGGFAEFVSVPVENIFEIPDNRPFEEACASLLVGLTSWRMLKRQANLQANQSVLIVGAGGGLNSFSIQLAKRMGARVIALTSGEEKEAKSLELGAHATINYKQSPEWHKEVKRLTDGEGVDVVVDNVGAETFSKSIKSLARGGTLVTAGSTSGRSVNFDNGYIFSKQLKIVGSTMGSREDFRHLLTMLWASSLKSPIDKVYPLEEGRQAFERLSIGEQFGKIVLCP